MTNAKLKFMIKLKYVFGFIFLLTIINSCSKKEEDTAETNIGNNASSGGNGIGSNADEQKKYLPVSDDVTVTNYSFDYIGLNSEDSANYDFNGDNIMDAKVKRSNYLIDEAQEYKVHYLIINTLDWDSVNLGNVGSRFWFCHISNHNWAVGDIVNNHPSVDFCGTQGVSSFTQKDSSYANSYNLASVEYHGFTLTTPNQVVYYGWIVFVNGLLTKSVICNIPDHAVEIGKE
jgi:hypothetical protein